MEARILDPTHDFANIVGMTMLELKQEVSRLSPRHRRELNAYMIRLRHQTPAWRKEISRRMKRMDGGKKITLIA
ncbi:MAG TPA: hypothetical protein VK737_01575 [Opitutales bacterium]|nr:hypothetical protein [Opitutales bacterium]